jgi:DNA-binding transcriptional LysR family regulator
MIDISLKQLECFWEVCRDFHFTNAAKRLNISQPPLSRHIQDLESAIGAKLFLREGKRVTLTTAGELFLKESCQIPAILARAREAALRAEQGEPKRLRIGFVGALMGNQLLAVFKTYRESNLDTQLALSDLSPANLMEELENGRLDGAFLGVRPKRTVRGVQCLAWKTESLRVILTKEHRLAKKRFIDPADLTSESLVTLSESVAPAFREKLTRIFKPTGKLPPIRSETTGVPAILGMVIAGSGFSILPQSALGHPDPSLVSIKLHSEEAKLEEVFLFKQTKENESLQSFIKLL